MRRSVLAGTVAGILALAGLAGTAAAKTTEEVYSFSGCTGPGVPSSFMAAKIALPDSASHPVSAASAFHVIGDSSDVFTIYDFGSGAPHGIDVSGVAVDWCWVGFAGQGQTLVGGAYHAG